MDINQIIVIIIVILTAIIIVLVTYFLTSFIINKRKTTTENKKYDSKNLIEEESLMNMMDEKRNIELSKKDENKRFINNDANVEIVTSKVLQKDVKINPFGINLKTPNTNNHELDIEDRSQNKFIK